MSAGLEGAAFDVRRAQLDDTLRLVAEVLRAARLPGRPSSRNSGARRSPAPRRSAATRRRSPASAWRATSTPTRAATGCTPESIDERVDELKTAKLEDAKRCYAELVGATGAQFVAVGDFDPEALSKLLEELFGGWKNPSPYARIPARYFERPAAASRRWRRRTRRTRCCAPGSTCRCATTTPTSRR